MDEKLEMIPINMRRCSKATNSLSVPFIRSDWPLCHPRKAALRDSIAVCLQCPISVIMKKSKARFMNNNHHRHAHIVLRIHTKVPLC